MSIIIEIHEKEAIDFADLYRYLQMRNSSCFCEMRTEDFVYFYRDKFSTRGVDIYKTEYGYEIRMTILSNRADYYTTVLLMEYFKMFRREAKIITEDGTKIKDIYNFFSDEIINENFERDAKTVKLLIELEGHIITFFGPKGEYYIGLNVLKKLEAEKEGFESRLEQFIKKIQYELPECQDATVMEIGDEEDNKKIIKMVHDSTNYILKQYDYLVFKKNISPEEFEDMIFITNDVINEHLPTEWELIDEYTIVAPALGKEKYHKLAQTLTPFDQKEQLKN